MLTETAQVTKTDGEFVWLEPRQVDHCGSCSLKKGCGHRLLNMFYDNRNSPLKARLANSLTVHKGDLVTVGLDEGKLLQLTALFYGVPLIFLIVLVSLANALAVNEGTMLAVAFLGLLTGLYFSRRWASRLEQRSLLAIDVTSNTETAPITLLQS